MGVGAMGGAAGASSSGIAFSSRSEAGLGLMAPSCLLLPSLKEICLAG